MLYDDLESAVEWKLWYQDLFDREAPQQIELRGEGLKTGLVELWARHLFETVQSSGLKGFNRFYLWWQPKNIIIEIIGKWEGQVRLRNWIYGNANRTKAGYKESGDKMLLNLIAKKHKNYILENETSEEILLLAMETQSCKDFKKKLLKLK